MTEESEPQRPEESVGTEEEPQPRRFSLGRAFACTMALLASPAALALFIPWLLTDPTSTGWLYLAGMVLVWGGALTSPWRRERFRGLIRIGCLSLALALAIRLMAAPDGDTMEMVRIPKDDVVANIVNRPIPEADSAMVGGWWITHGTYAIDDPDGTFLDAMRESYALLAADQGIVGSPWAATYLGMQSRESFDMQVFETDSKSAVIFLHGFGGNFTLPCWEVAQAARMADYATFCPSTEPRGRWWLGGSVAIVRETLEHVRQQGYERIVLAGLSNGGIGLSRIAPQFVGKVNGFIFLSGVSAQATPVDADTLVVHGDRDAMTETSIARNYAKRAPFGKYFEVDGGHFVLLEDRDEIRPVIADWLRTRR